MSNGICFNDYYPNIVNSENIFNRSRGLIPCNTQTMAKGPTQYVDGVAPKYLAKGKGCYVWDVDGNQYIDYNMAIGPVTLGYGFPEVDNAIKKQLDDGITFSLMHPLEVEVAERIQEMIPYAEAVRFSKTGAEATSAAIRIARAVTGKDRVLCCGYHGWHDWYASTLSRNAGIPESVKELTNTFEYNNYKSLLNSFDGNVAAVILEPVVFEAPEDGFLYKVADLCKRKGAILIFDEMWTGFRIANGGAQEYYGVQADLATFSKGVANGMPLSVITGRWDLMQVLEEDVFFFNTFGGEALSLAAAAATLAVYSEQPVVKHIANMGNQLTIGINHLIQQSGADFVTLKGLPYRTLTTFDSKAGDPVLIKSYFQQELIKRGILWSGFNTISFSHTAHDIEYTLKVWEEVLYLVNDSVKKCDTAYRLRGNPIIPSARPVLNFNSKPAKP